ncbi:HAD-like domain-containing protein [Phlyctochytrium arcticum]|nr:HAD-like domain-containing protein [Phlyctochytrium arcticum]
MTEGDDSGPVGNSTTSSLPPRKRSASEALNIVVTTTTTPTTTMNVETKPAKHIDSSVAEHRLSAPMLALTATWQGKKYPIDVPAHCTIGEVKLRLAETTQVLPERQKLIGFVKGKLPGDDVVLSTLDLKPSHSFMMLGTVEHKIHQEPAVGELPEVVNDLDYDFLDYIPTDDRSKNDERNKRKLKEYIDKTNITVFNPLRPGKKMLVLDLDYTLFDCKSTAGHISELARPGMHEMLTAVYPYYDICIWSQTSWKWLEMKVTELGILTHPAYRIAFVMDRSTMFSITSTTRRVDGKPVKHEVKALDIIWTKFGDRFGPHNTIHVDDVGRNFAMNPQSGLKISAFKNAPMTRATDRALYPLTRYLLQLSLVDNFGVLEHKYWKTFNGPLPDIVPPTPELGQVEEGPSVPWGGFSQ